MTTQPNKNVGRARSAASSRSGREAELAPGGVHPPEAEIMASGPAREGSQPSPYSDSQSGYSSQLSSYASSSQELAVPETQDTGDKTQWCAGCNIFLLFTPWKHRLRQDSSKLLFIQQNRPKFHEKRGVFLSSSRIVEESDFICKSCYDQFRRK
jgi:hypothetical protein